MSLQRRAPNSYTSDFPYVIKFCVAAHTKSEKAIRFRHPDYNPDRAQKLISSSMSWHLSTRNISSKSMHAFLSNLANRQTDKLTRANAFASSFVGGNYTKSCQQRWSIHSCSCYKVVHWQIWGMVVDFRIRSVVVNFCLQQWKNYYKKLSCRRETARHFVSLNILLSHSRLLKIIRNDTAA